MRTFWLGLAALTMAGAAWASDDSDVKVGDWVKRKVARGVMDKPFIEMALTQVKAIEDGMATLDIRRTERIPGKDQSNTDFSEIKISLTDLNSIWGHYRDGERRGVKLEVLEEGVRTVEVNGVTFEDVLYRKVKNTIPAEINRSESDLEWVTEVWHDGKASSALAWPLKQVNRNVITMEVVLTAERVAYGRAGDPIPEDGD